MRVILKENIEKLGIVGDIVSVSEGFARNFLLPRGLVVHADDSRVKELEHNKKILEKKRLALKSNSQELAAKLENHSCTLKRKIGKGDKLFGSVTSQDIFKELENAGLHVPRTALSLKDPIKTLGVHEVPFKLIGDVVGKIKVWVVKEE